MIDMGTLAERLEEAEAASGKSAYRVCRDAGVDLGNYGKIKKGERGARVTIEWIEQVAPALGVRAAWLAFGEMPMKSAEGDDWTASEHPLDTAIRYEPGRYGVDVVEAVRKWAADHPEAELTPPQWTRQLEMAQEAALRREKIEDVLLVGA